MTTLFDVNDHIPVYGKVEKISTNTNGAPVYMLRISGFSYPMYTGETEYCSDPYSSRLLNAILTLCAKDSEFKEKLTQKLQAL